MGSVQRLKEAFNAANDFLKEEIQNARGDSIVEILSRKLPNEAQSHGCLRSTVMGKALQLLHSIHSAFVEPADGHDEGAQSAGLGEDPALEDAKRRRTLHALLDLISLEGIYPSLSKDVGIPLEKRLISVLPAGVIAKQSQAHVGDKSQDEALLNQILTVLNGILLDGRPSIQPILRDRILPDIISGTAELAFNSESLPQDAKGNYKHMLRRVINDTPTPTILPILSSFLVSAAPPWFKPEIASQLSHIPLRKDGVLQTIIFITSQFAPSLGHDASESNTDKPTITVQAIMQISRLLSSVPSGMSPESYIQNIAPKLLALVDGDDLDLKKVASYVIGSGILGKRSSGAPGSVGHTIFVRPIFDALNANITETSRPWLRRFTDLDGAVLTGASADNLGGEIIVNEGLLLLSVDRLSALTLLHPNPGLLKRLIPPILLPLWGLTCYSKENEKPWWHNKALKLLEVYFSISGEALPLRKLADRLLWDGTPTWIYGPGNDGGISIRKRGVTNQEAHNLIMMMESLDLRADQFLDLLKAAPQADEITGDIFLHVSKQWLLEPSLGEPGLKKRELLQNDVGSDRVFRKLVSAKIAEKLLEKFKDTLSRQPLKVLELIQHLIGNEIDRQKEQIRKAQGLENASLSSLGNIVRNQENREGNGDTAVDEESSELLSASFSLLSTILSSPEFAISETSLPALENIKSQLDQVTKNLPPSLSQPATTASMLLEIQLSSPLSSGPQDQSASSLASDLQAHRQAIANIASDLAPIQVEGLSALSGLIAKSSPILDIPSTISLLLSLIAGSNSETANNDEFVYLNAIKAMGSLASRHPRTAVKTLVDRYSDKNEEETLDQRLKIGEALLRTVQELGNALVGETVSILADSMISVAGRRGRKPEAKKTREKQLRKERGNILSSQEDSGPSSQKPNLPKQEQDNEMDSDTEDPERAAQTAGILDAWAAGATSDEEPEDLRIRASAISILASAIETNITGMGQSVASASVDLALSTLTLEPRPESAILRRAAVILILDIVKAIDTSRDSGLGFGFGFGPSGAEKGSNIANIHDVLRVLNFVESKETDSIVRGHIRNLIESLEAWVQKSLMWGIGEIGDGEIDIEPKFGIDSDQQLAGLDVHPLSNTKENSQGRGPLVEEIE